MDQLCYLCFCVCHQMFSCLFIAALWSPAGKGWPLGSLVCDVLLCVVFHFPKCVLGQVWCLIVLIPDLCLLSYFNIDDRIVTSTQIKYSNLMLK